MFKFGNLEINSKVVLGPMAGITSSGYRKFFDTFNPGFSVSEMVSDMGLIYGNKETTLYVTFDKLQNFTGVQLFGHDPQCIKNAAIIAQNLNKNIDFFDINMGCPVPKVCKTGAGSALLQNPQLCGEIVKAIKSVTEKPVSAKIRLGYNDNDLNFMAVIHALEDAGVDLISIHPRSRKEMYYGNPHYELVSSLRKQMKVPLVISGNIFTLEDAINALEITGADAVMVARGGMGNPFLVEQINHYFETGEKLSEPSFVEQKKYCLELAGCLIEEKGESSAMRVYRAIAPKFFNGLPNGKGLKTALASKLVTYDSLVQIIEEYEKENILE